MILNLKEDEMLGRKPFLDFGFDGFICGGAIRAWFCGDEKTRDIDIFFKSESDWMVGNDKLSLLGFKKRYESVNALTFVRDDLVVQTVRARYRETIEATLEAFDFHNCCFGYDILKKEIYVTKAAIISVLRKRLAVNHITPELALDSLRRSFKYIQKGYVPCAGAIRDLALALGMTEEVLSKQVELYPDGKPKIIRFD